MFATISGECQCGNPEVIANVTRVTMSRGVIQNCEECHPELKDEVNDDPNALNPVRVRILGQVWAKPDGSWCVFKAECDGEAPPWAPSGASRPFSLVGPIGGLQRGDVVMVIGRFLSNAKYGFQFETKTAPQLCITESDAGMVAWLKKFPNIGQIRAEELIRKLGGFQGVLDALEHEPNRLTCVTGMTEERCQEVKEAFDKTSGFREWRMFAAKLGLTEGVIAAAIEEWGDDAQNEVNENPFNLQDLPARVGFKLADEVAGKLGFSPKDPRRCAAGILYALNSIIAAEGHTYVLEETLRNPPSGRTGDSLRRLGLTADEIEVGLVALSQDRPKRRRFREGGVQTFMLPPHIVRVNDRVYPRDVYQAEVDIARELHRLLSAEVRAVEQPRNAFAGMVPAPEQLEALRIALEQSVLVLTGGPGVGKTKTVNEILNALMGRTQVLCAPTAKAAKRMTELCGRKASTIHRLVAQDQSSSDAFSISADVIVVDEVSMVDTVLLARLLRCVRTGTRLILVGDVDQLPSIGPGRVLYDIIESACLPTVRLTHIFRQQSDGCTKRIPDVARAINTGECPDLSIKGTDVNFLAFDEPELIQEAIVKAVTDWIPRRYEMSPDDIQVIAPQRGEFGKPNYAIGVTALNIALQDAINPKVDVELHIGDGYVARVNDRVMHTRNDYDLTAMNGDQGVVTLVSPTPFVPPLDVVTSARTKRAKEALEMGEPSTGGKREKAAIMLIVDFGDRKVGYTKQEVRDLNLAYCVTCHKCQGSQYKAVVMPIHRSNSFMLTRPLVYTAVTRAESRVLLIGQADVLSRATRNVRGQERRTSLQEHLLTPAAPVVRSYTYEARLEADV